MNVLPNVRLAHLALPIGWEMAIVELLHLSREPTLDMHPIGDMTDWDVPLFSGWPKVFPHAAGNVAVQLAHRVGCPGHFQSNDRHAKGFSRIVGVHSSKSHQSIGADSQCISERSQVFFDQSGSESIMSRRDRSVRGENGCFGCLSHCIVKGEAVVRHSFSHDFERDESAMAFVEMINSGVDPKRPQRLDSANANNQFLSDASTFIAAVESTGQLAIFWTIAFDIAVQQKQPDSSDLYFPDFGEQTPIASIDCNHKWRSIGKNGGLER